jgi:hypothetical protein
MRRSHPRRTVILTTLSLVLLGLALAAASCSSLGADDVDTTTEPSATDTTVASSTGRISADNILFRDDFQDGDTEGWQVSGAWVVQQDGDVYTFDATDSGFAAVPKGVSWNGDYAFKAAYLLTAGTLAFSFDVTTGSRYYVPIDQQRISLVKEDGAGNKTVLTQAQAPELGKQHYITIAKQRGLIQVYVDKTLWLATTDASPLATGTVAVGSATGTTASVDNVLVNKIVRTLPAGTPAVAAIAAGQVVQPSDDGADLNSIPDSDDGVPDLNEDNHPNDLPAPTVQFAGWTGGNQGSDAFSASPGSEIILSWSVIDAQEVFLNDEAVEPEGTQTFTPAETTVYTLTVTDLVGGSHDYTVTVTVGDSGQGETHGPDLSVSTRVTEEEGTKVLVSVTISNSGDQDTQAQFKWYAHESDGQVSRSSTVTLAAGDSTTIEFGYDYGQSGTMHWKTSVVTQPQGLDVNTSNNSTKGTVTLQQ